MGIRTKSIATVLIIGLVVTAVYFTGDSSLFKGMLKVGSNKNLPDLVASIQVTEKNGDLYAEATITNAGEVAINGEEGFTYNLYVNEMELLVNEDIYSSMEAQSSFSFMYKIGECGGGENVKFVVDSGGKIEELDENNNEAETQCTIKGAHR